MFQRIAFLLLMALGFTITAQTINLRGTVTNKTGKPIANAIITLVGQGLKDTTGADGAFSITKNSTALLSSLIPKTEKIALNRGVLELTLSNPSPVKVEIFNAKGDLLKKESLQDAAAGIYRLNIAENFHAANLLIINASIGRHMTTFRYLPLHNGTYEVTPSVEKVTPSNGKLAKMAAAVDSLKTSAANYLSSAVAISSYDTTVTITLDTVGSAVTVQLAQTEQTIMGFGVNNVWSGGWSDADADKIFDSTSGLGLTVLRIGMEWGGTPSNGNSCWTDIQKGKSRGLKYVIGSTWTAPVGYKTNNSLVDGGYLKPEDYTLWANTIAAFPGMVKTGSGMDLYAMSIANEPDFASCGYTEPCNGDYNTMLYNDTQMVKFLKIVGPKLHAAGCKVMAPEASEWLHLWSDSSACCSVPDNKPSSNPFKGHGYDYGHTLYKDTAAWNVLDIIAIHQYDSQISYPWPGDVLTKKPVWETEMSGVKWWPEQGTLTQSASANGGYNVAGTSDIANGLAVAGWVHNGLTVGNAAVWCYWWWLPLGSTNEGLVLPGGSDTKRHYTFGNFTKYVRPGMVRVDITGAIPANVLLSAYKGPNTVVIVAINKGTAAVTVPITISGGTIPGSFTPIVTSAQENWSSKIAVTVTGGILNATLAATTVTTFVGK
jgi:glucuronoarabinoxylan endo-1,4-beta-xylanase